MKRLPWILVFTFVGALACSPTMTLSGQEELLVLEVAPNTVPCVGEMADQCIRVRSPGEEEWKSFYDPIEGFERTEGIGYTIEVARRKVPNPPADGSSYAYRLVRIISEEPGVS